MRWNFIGGVIIGILLLLWWAWPSPTHRRVYSQAEGAEIARVFQQNMELRKKQAILDEKYDNQVEENSKALDDILFKK
jgi:hypothetical protein